MSNTPPLINNRLLIIDIEARVSEWYPRIAREMLAWLRELKAKRGEYGMITSAELVKKRDALLEEREKRTA